MRPDSLLNHGSPHTISEASGDASGEFDEPVDGFGVAIASSVAREVTPEHVTPRVDGASQACNLEARAGQEHVKNYLRDTQSLSTVGLPVCPTQLLRATPSNLDLDALLVGGERRLEASLLPVGEIIFPSSQNVADQVADHPSCNPTTRASKLSAAAE
ncbi:Uncharacterised protein [Actinomyces bovis]|uniref:Uncharacterized protein n=1 Tax=Actinomyces bovis TaxID=1658 RepID=A0ABY1VT52_9ACTO|nr:hypothetical protein [Actinomyces bovis]SPT54208.1 Uncharacterised protein [Actinomyces bovis]VEG56539.1 Uncharacterised protein [Actinomyces israelii]